MSDSTSASRRLLAALRIPLVATFLVAAFDFLFRRWYGLGEPYRPAVFALAMAAPALLLGIWGPARLQRPFAFAAGLGIALVGVAYFLMGVEAAWPFTTDDAYITLRYARNWVEGHGIVWNPGESPPVEGYSNFPYLLLGAAALKLGLEPAAVLKHFSVASALAMLGVVFQMLRPLVGWLLAGIAVLYLALFPGTVWWAVSGLETAFFQLLVAGAFALSLPLLRRRGERDRPALALAGFVSFLAAWLRPEGILVAGTLLPALFLSDLFRLREQLPWKASLLAAGRRTLPFATASLLPYLLYFLWRWSYFERLLPNTVLCKAGTSEEPWRLIRELYENHRWMVWLASLSLLRFRDPRILAMAFTCVIATAILFGVHPIIAHWNRHSLGILPLLVGLAMVGLALLSEALRRVRLLAPLPVLLVLTFTLPMPQFESFARSAERYEARNEIRRSLARTLDALAPDEDAWVFFGDAGVTPYHSRLRYLDAYCLNAREATMPPISNSPQRFAAYALEERKPEFIVLQSRSFNLPMPRGHIWEEVLEHPAFARDYELAWRMKGDSVSRYWVFRRKEGSRAGVPVVRGDDVDF